VKISKLILIILVTMMTVVTFWYASSRLLSSANAVKSYELSPDSTYVASSSQNSLRVGGYNIAHARGGQLGASNWQNRSRKDLLQHLDSIASQIQKAQLDIVVLNEVDFSAAWSLDLNQAKHIATKAGYPYIVEQRNMDIALPFFKFKFGNAILSRHPIVKSEFLAFPAYAAWEDILAGNHDGVLSTIQTPMGVTGIVAIHLEYRSEAIRVKAARKLVSVINRYDFPVIAIGDFNSTPLFLQGSQKNTSGINAVSFLLDQGGFQTAPNIANGLQQFSFPSQNPSILIDWVLEKGSLDITESNIVHSALSDHLMVVSELKANDGQVKNTSKQLTPQGEK